MHQKLVIYLVVVVCILLLDTYVFVSFQARVKQWSRMKQFLFKRFYWSLTILFVALACLNSWFRLPIIVNAVYIACFFATYLSKICYVVFLLIDDIRRGVIWFNRKITKPIQSDLPTLSRSDFLLKTGIVVAGIPFASFSFGIVAGAYDYRVRHRTLYLANLPDSFDGIKIAQLSDIHSGSFYRKQAVIGGVKMLLDEKPDIVFFTGDLVNMKSNEMYDYQDVFARVQAPLGVYSVLGNHDYGDYSSWPSLADKRKNLQDLIDTHKNMGWQLLMNEHKRIRINHSEIAIVGIENWGTGRFPKYGRLNKALENTDDVPVKLLLSHDPSHWRAQVIPEYPQIDAMFAGHTHGMQMGIQWGNFQMSPASLIYKEWSGLYQEQHQQLYVNVGFGFLGLPGRLGILPEITIFELKKGTSFVNG